MRDDAISEAKQRVHLCICVVGPTGDQRQWWLGAGLDPALDAHASIRLIELDDGDTPPFLVGGLSLAELELLLRVVEREDVRLLHLDGRYVGCGTQAADGVRVVVAQIVGRRVATRE